MGNSCACVSKSAEVVSDPRPTYLDGLPLEVLDNVVRHLSAKPRGKNWQNYIAMEDALTLYADSLSPGLSKIARHHFRALSAPISIGSDGALVADIGSYRETRLFVKLLEAGGSSFVHFYVDLEGTPITFSCAFSNVFARHCTSVRHLSLSGLSTRFPLRRILKPRAGQLESLEISSTRLSKAHVDAIAKHCNGLRKLSLTCIFGWAQYASIWKTVGPTLHELSLTADFCDDDDDYVMWEDTLTEVAKHCVHLNDITFAQLPSGAQVNIEHLCTSLGANLKKLCFRECYITPNAFTDILRACPNVLVDMEIEADFLVDTLSALGSRADTIRYSGYQEDLLGLDVARAASECSNITTLIIEPLHDSTPELLSSILVSPKPFLHTVMLCESYDTMTSRYRIAMDSLDALTARTGGIRHFTFLCELLPPDSFRAFANANLQLETVAIHIVTDEDDVEEEVVYPQRCPTGLALASIIEAFSVSTNLRELSVEGMYGVDPDLVPERFKQVEDVCLPLRNRKVHVSVYGVVYLP